MGSGLNVADYISWMHTIVFHVTVTDYFSSMNWDVSVSPVEYDECSPDFH